MATHLTAVRTPDSEATMALPDQIKNLRKEHGWSQADLATRVGGDAGQISRYENDKITPSVEAVIRLAEIFDVSTDYLLLDNVPRRPHRAPADPLLDRLTDLDTLTDADRAALLHILDSLIANTRIRAALHNAG
jgi:transcriptional regulator with XRE-family HTH domain